MREAIHQRILVLDGAMGTMIQQYKLSEDDFRGERFADTNVLLKGNNDLLNITRPDIIADIHRRYIDAGADIITTNTFNSQRISQADYCMEDHVYEMARKGARIARDVADSYKDLRKVFVAGSVGPTNKTCSISPTVDNPAARDLDYDTLRNAYYEQVCALVEGGVDAILIETIFDTLNAKAAIDASLNVREETGIHFEIMLSMTVSDVGGRTLSGQTIKAFLSTVADYPIFSVGINCSFGARQMKSFIKEMARSANCYVSAYPNAGLPNTLGLYDETPETMANQIKEYIDEGLVNIIGGCCGTTEKFIEQYIPLVKDKAPRVIAERNLQLSLSGLEELDVTPEIGFINVGERCNVAGSRKFLRLINEKNYTEALTIARKQVEDGAMIIDINMDDGLLDARAEMVNFLNMIASEPDIAKVPVMIDSSDWAVIKTGLKCVQGKCIVNSISLKEGEQPFINKARTLMRFGAAVVVMCFDEEGQATSYERRIAIAERSYKILTETVGMKPHNIIFDPNILSVATGMEEHDAYALDFIRATEWIRKNLPEAHVSGGVSNLSFAFRGNNYIREAMHAVFLYHAIQKGMDFGIVNPATKISYSDIPDKHLKIIEDVILNKTKEASEHLIRLAEEINTKKNAGEHVITETKASLCVATECKPVGERLAEALIKGIADNLESDMAEALTVFDKAVDIIEGPLMNGMNAVGELFGSGKMFLPQIVKSARTMKQAVAILEPRMEAERAGTTTKAGKILLATVKGDVHDIGKNIVGVIMACNSYEVVDLGVMVSADEIVRKAIVEQPDIIGLSGLITPSLEEMVFVAKELTKQGITTPIMIGGATTSEMHVALKIAPEYNGVVVWMKDASQNALIAPRLVDEASQSMFKQELDERYAHLRAEYHSSHKTTVSLEEARENKLKLF